MAELSKHSDQTRNLTFCDQRYPGVRDSKLLLYFSQQHFKQIPEIQNGENAGFYFVEFLGNFLIFLQALKDCGNFRHAF